MTDLPEKATTSEPPEARETRSAGRPAPPQRRRIPFEGIVLCLVLALSLFGIGITDYSPMKSRHYWAAMTLVLALSGIAIGGARAKRIGRPVGEYLVDQLVHWAATGAAVGGVFLLLESGRLNYENTGLVLLLLLGLSTFLDGFRVGWHFSLIGVLMFLAAIIAGFVEQYLWVLLVVSGGMAIAAILWERRRGVGGASEEAAMQSGGPGAEDAGSI
ncbi:MAG TPA: hypothetical protein ENI85_08595 [Deltaproteobacteria bacterium]|nr:hypothetical protein [Deltaproteobacteria bacterium]